MDRRRRSEWWERRRSRAPRRVRGGARLESRRGRIGETWWSERWIGVLESFGWHNRLLRGRTYARGGQVVGFDLLPGLVTARVQGSRPQPYDVEIRLRPLGDREWDRVLDPMATQAIFAAKLLAGEMPRDIEGAFRAARIPLFPRSGRDLQTACTCPDWANPCKHIAAVYYVLAERFDKDPFMLFVLRGRTKEQILEALRVRRLAPFGGPVRESAPVEKPAAPTEPPDFFPPAPPPALPVEDTLDRFWEPLAPLKEIEVTLEKPPVPCALLRRLGDPPNWKEPVTFAGFLDPLYRQVRDCAVALALSEGGAVVEDTTNGAPRNGSRS
ncbi:MAG: SWIM zinc finger family protein [Nitrospirae bacterium]|nr:SWIM zinc finger family protein [Nitrospirota bacterium]